MSTALLVLSALLLSHNSGVRTYRAVRYFDGSDAHPTKHLLDLYLPARGRSFPLVIFVHGGAWTRGDKAAYSNAYQQLGEAISNRGMGVAVINYRLSPEVVHPEHARDVARAVAWLYSHSEEYGWSRNRLFLVGHSAGAHLSALVTVKPDYLKAFGLTPGVIRGVVGISGVYDLTLGGVTARMLYEPVFTSDPRTLAEASPAQGLKGRTPPFLLLYAENDYPSLDIQARRFEKALKKVGSQARTEMIPGRDHVSIVAGLMREGDPVRALVMDFVNQ